MKKDYASSSNLKKKTESWLKAALSYTPHYRNIPFSIRRSALLVLDMQLFFTSPNSHAFIPASHTILPNIQRLIKRFHSAKRPVVFTLYAARKREAPTMRLFWHHILSEREPLAALDARLTLSSKDLLIRKPSYSSFGNRRLKTLLEKTATEQVVVCGVMTHLCCDTAAREAFLNGYTPFLVADATASITEDLHTAALKTASHGYAVVTSTDALL